MIHYERARFDGIENSDEFVQFLNDWALLGYELIKTFETVAEPKWGQMTAQEQAEHAQGKVIRRFFTDCILVKRS